MKVILKEGYGFKPKKESNIITSLLTFIYKNSYLSEANDLALENHLFNVWTIQIA